jgi:hypothetical protein
MALRVLPLKAATATYGPFAEIIDHKEVIMECRLNSKELGVLFSVVFLIFCGTAHAGNIDPANDGSRYAWSENAGWINLEPFSGPGVTVTDLAVEGYAWGENIGWINLSPANGGVVNDGNGILSGYAWGENAGWISFSCTNTGTCATVDYGVAIDPVTGEFGGKAWGENIGWISFNSTGAVPYGVTTLWVADSGDNGGGGGGGSCGTLITPGDKGGPSGPMQLILLSVFLWTMRRWGQRRFRV